jgi:hypothetical protein
MRKHVIKGDRLHRRAPLVMGGIAALLLVTAVLSQRASREVSLLQQKANDQWAYYESKRMQVLLLESFRDLAGAISKGAPKADQPKSHLDEKYTEDIERYRAQLNAIQEEAHGFDAGLSQIQLRARRLYIAEILLEISLMVSSLAMLTRQAWFWYAVLFFGFAGAVNLIAVWR